MKISKKTITVCGTVLFLSVFSSSLPAAEETLENLKAKKDRLSKKIFRLQKELFDVNMKIEKLKTTKTEAKPATAVPIPAATPMPKATAALPTVKKKKSGFKLFRFLGKPKPKIVYAYENIGVKIDEEWKGFDRQVSLYLKEIVDDYMENYATVTGTLAKNGKTRIQKGDIIKFSIDATEYFLEVIYVDSEDGRLTFSIYRLVQPPPE